MKKISQQKTAWFLVVTALLIPVMCHAQHLTQHDTRAEVMADLQKTGGVYAMYDFDTPPPTRPPKGYKPVYISHIGRHGARYALTDNIYEKMELLLEKAHRAGALTDAGEALYRRYEAFYPQVAHRGGELTRKGQEQHRRIAATMFRDYPAVFRGPTHAEVTSTTSHRVLVSMFSFLDELHTLDRDFNCAVDAGDIYLPALLPVNKKSPGTLGLQPIPAEAAAVMTAFNEQKRQPDHFAAKYFRDIAFLTQEYGVTEFQQDWWVLVSDLSCLDFEPEDRFSDVFTPQERYDFWESWNFYFYLKFARCPLSDGLNCLQSCSVLRDFINKAEEDLANGSTDLRLRFSHDSALAPLLAFMRIDNWGAEVEQPEAVADIWRSFEIPMACNFQLIFFRGRKGQDLLVKALVNGREAHLPFPSVTGPFYAWSDFTAYYRPLIDDAEARLTLDREK